MLDEMRISPACFVRAPRHCTSCPEGIFSSHFNMLHRPEKLPSNFFRSECCCDPAVDVFYLDELITKRLRFALQIRQHPSTILLFIRLLARVNVICPITQHALDQPGQLMRGRRNRFGRPQPGPHPTVIGTQGTMAVG